MKNTHSQLQRPSRVPDSVARNGNLKIFNAFVLIEINLLVAYLLSFL
jgi:hypothetical protein